jgi:gamma-glutamyl-gamma-aminobutyrate hydrolase PuuD
MSKTSTAAKRRYNTAAYDRHEFVVRKNTRLAELVRKQKKETVQGLSALIIKLLAAHFGVDERAEVPPVTG